MDDVSIHNLVRIARRGGSAAEMAQYVTATLAYDGRYVESPDSFGSIVDGERPSQLTTEPRPVLSGDALLHSSRAVVDARSFPSKEQSTGGNSYQQPVTADIVEGLAMLAEDLPSPVVGHSRVRGEPSNRQAPRQTVRHRRHFVGDQPLIPPVRGPADQLSWVQEYIHFLDGVMSPTAPLHPLISAHDHAVRVDKFRDGVSMDNSLLEVWTR